MVLPAAAVFHFLWEMNSDLVKDGASIRTFGRLTDYLPEESKAILTSHHASVQYQVSIQTTFVEPFDPIIGAQYIVLGELEKSQGDSEAVVRARVFNCVDGVDVALLQKAVNEQRTFFRERNDEADA
ncbi:CST complex subunit TEN1 isoform X1 [Ictalurus punctatus]|uniref:CST complex subunit TEN1 n=1 Tax=Ictalurus punctatus TaxID=7998 RepID=A0A2D0S5X7_ICTPU|nr:CST complex subunit TEN1 isoform X1 [Ictalurus punctatus]